MRSGRDASGQAREEGRVSLDASLLTIFGVTLMAVLGVSSVTPAFPTIAADLGVSSRSIGLLITVFTLPGIFLAPILGVLADRFGRKRILAPSLFVFALAGGACGTTHNFHAMLLLRFLQGIGAASLGSLNTTIIGDLYEGRRQVAAMGYNASVLSIGTASYPLVGGALTVLGWSYPFFLPLLAVPVGLAVIGLLHSPAPRNREGLRRYIGNLGRAFDRRLWGLVLASTLTFIVLYGAYLTYFPFLLSRRFAASPLVIGLLLSSMSVFTALASARLEPLTTRFGSRSLLMGAYVLYLVATLVTPLMPGLAWLLLPAALFGLGNGINIPTIQSLLAGEVSAPYRGAVMSVNAMALRAGQTLGPVLMGLCFAAAGIGSVFLAGAAVSVLLIALTVVWIR